MEAISEELVGIGESFAQSYTPVLDFYGWRVAMLRYFDIVAPENFNRVERHLETNEVFILTTGQADLVICPGQTEPGRPHVVQMRPHVAYNIRRAVWHHVVMEQDAHIVLFERSNTGAENSEYAHMPTEWIAATRARFTVAASSSDAQGVPRDADEF